MKFYFFKTAMESGKQHLFPLSGQTFANGAPIDPTCHTRADRKLRDAHPLGTIFYSNSITEINAGGKKCYSAPWICPVMTPDPKPTLLTLDENITTALRAITGTLSEPENEKARDKAEAKPEPKRKSSETSALLTGSIFADDENYAETEIDNTPMTLLEQIRTAGSPHRQSKETGSTSAQMTG